MQILPLIKKGTFPKANITLILNLHTGSIKKGEIKPLSYLNKDITVLKKTGD